MLTSLQQKPRVRCPSRTANSQCARLCRLLATAVAATFAVPLEEVLAPTRGSPQAAFARQTAMYLAHVVLGRSVSEIGVLFGRDRTTAAYACRMIEERRDDPAIDAVVQSLEELCGELARGFFAGSGVQR